MYSILFSFVLKNMFVSQFCFIASICSLNVASGDMCSNGSVIQKYYYNPATRSCLSFTYQGCGGNDNIFTSQQLCEDFCMPSKTLLKFTHAYSTLKVKAFLVVGLCNRGSPQYSSGQSVLSCSAPGQCQQGYECSPPVFGGGSSLCCPSRSDFCCLRTFSSRYQPHHCNTFAGTICSSAPDQGKSCTSKSSSPVSRWHYSDITKSCQQFSFNGCGGNGNNFDSQADCLSFCIPPTTTTMAPPPTPPPPPPLPSTTAPYRKFITTYVKDIM